MSATPAIHISRDRFHLAWDPAIPPIETVADGDEVEFDLLDASGGQLTATSTVADIATLDFGSVDQVNGPIAIDGAEAASAPLNARGQMVACYYEQDALTGLSPAEYRIRVDDNVGVLAEGTFTVR